jgi:hypothetical protein
LVGFSLGGLIVLAWCWLREFTSWRTGECHENLHVAETITHLALDLQRWRSGLTRKEIEIPGGLRYVYLEGGRGEPLLLLHGFGGNKDTLRRLHAT